jgi:hypothetical protein
MSQFHFRIGIITEPWLWLWFLTPLSTIFQLLVYREYQYLEKSTDLLQVADKFDHSTLRMSRIRTHNISGDRK